ncbi:hypothetical protein TNCV_2928671 [Trichonephila clavipes]|nr:hypothetical protein TNCV_2928671 [Trichonephila clavipes]
MLNNDEIVTSVQEESDPVDDETDEDEDNNNNESSKGPSNANAFSVLETAMECNRLRWLGHIWRSPENNQTRASLLRILWDLEQEEDHQQGG